jgi:hypothetical protein
MWASYENPLLTEHFTAFDIYRTISHLTIEPDVRYTEQIRTEECTLCHATARKLITGDQPYAPLLAAGAK